MPVTVAEIMSRDVVAVDANSRVGEAARQMRNHHVGDVLVLAQDHLSGILTDRDIVIRVIAPGLDPARVCVGEVASKEQLVVVDQSEAIDSARKLMTERGVRRLIVASDGAPIGVVSRADLEREMAPDGVLAHLRSAPPDE